MKVSELMTHEVTCCRPTDTLADAARVMWEQDCGCVPVVDAEGRVEGMVTDRDACMASYTRGASLDALHVYDAMAVEPSCCRPEDDLNLALDAMAKRQVHRLPVVDAEGHAIGMLSIADVLNADGPARGRKRPQDSERIVRTMRAIARPRIAEVTLTPAKTSAPEPVREKAKTKA